MEDTNPNSQEHGPSGYKIPAIRTYENDIAEAAAQKKISSASISIAETERQRQEAQGASTPASDSKTVHKKPEPPSTTTAGNSFIPAMPLTPIPTAKVEEAPKDRVETTPVFEKKTEQKDINTGANNNPTIASVVRTPSAIVIPKERRLERVVSNNSNGGAKKLLIGFFICILVIGGIGGGYYLYTIRPQGNTVPIPIKNNTSTVLIPSIVTPNTQEILDITGKQGAEIVTYIKQTETKLQQYELHEIIFRKKNPSTNSGQQTLTAPEFISKLWLNTPDNFVSSLNPNLWMFGVDSTGNNNSSPFVLFTTNFFQNTFAGMLAWEPTLPLDLSSIFNFPINSSGKYEDRILHNKNIREFVNASGTPLFLYGFLDQDRLLITRNESTFSDVVDRIEKQTYIR